MGLGLGLLVISIVSPESEHSSAATRSPFLLLTCSASSGQQGRGGEIVVGGVEGLQLKASSDFSSLSPLRGPGGKRYFVYKAYLAVSPTVTGYATVSIVSPKDARLFYGRSSEVGALASRAGGIGLVTASRRGVRLPVCGQRFTGYVGGFIIRKPSLISVVVTSPHGATQRTTIDVGTK